MTVLSAPIRLRVFVVLAGLALGPRELPGATERIGLEQLAIARWGRESGLPSQSVRALDQGADGFLWIGTAAGLSRFDGHGFRTFDALNTPSMPASSVTALARDGQGRLWVGFENGGVRRFAGPGDFVLEPWIPEGVAGTSVQALLFDRAGAMWVGAKEGLWVVSPERSGRFPFGSGDRRSEVQALLADSGGEIVVRSDEPAIWRIAPDGSARSQEVPENCFGFGLAIHDDALLFTCPNGLWTVPAGSTAAIPLLRVTNPEGLWVDRGGSVWFGTREGLGRLDPSGRSERLASDRGIGDWRLRAFYQDPAGDLWIGSFSAGLSRLRAGPVRAVGAAEGLPLTATTAVLSLPDDTVFVGSYWDGAALWDQHRGLTAQWTDSDGLPSNRVFCAALDPGRPGRIWVGTSRGLAAIEDGKVTRGVSLGLPYDDAVYLIHAETDPESGSLTIWAGGWEGGLVQVEGGAVRKHDAERGLGLDRVRFLHRDQSGRLLAGGDEGLYFLAGEDWQPWSGNGEFGFLRGLVEGQDGTLWLISERDGLVRVVPGAVERYGDREGFPSDGLHSVAADASGGLWVSTNEGLFRFEKGDFAEWARGEHSSVPVEHLSARDGLRDPECNGWGRPAVARLSDGTIVYPTTSGIALVDPAQRRSVELVPAEIRIDTAWAGGRYLDPSEPAHLKPHERSLHLTFSAIEFLRPEAVDFRYRLEATDGDWIPAGSVREANYSGLRPGNYRFHLQARLPGRDWVDASDRLAVIVEPTLLENLWVRFLAVSVGGLLALGALRWWAVVQGRHRAALRESRHRAWVLSRRLLTAQEEERRKLSRELHDDVTQRLAGLSMLATQAARAASDGTAREAYSELGTELSLLTDDVERLSRDLHPSTLENFGLAAALRSECATFAERSGVAVDLDTGEVPEDLSPEIGVTAYRVTQEALRNAWTHSQATTVRVTLRADRRELSLEIADSGVGFDQSAGRTTPGIGLESMRERAHLVGGRLLVETAPGRGTRICLRVPIDDAARRGGV